jgi:predicted AlkP superfamily phosphohydrolase/phosphomutase
MSLFNWLRRKSPTPPKLLVIGLDCAPPELLFASWRHELPNLKRLMDTGEYRELISSIPAITVPAWSCMTSGKDPGVLGFYGFRNRRDYSYDNRFIATGSAVKEKRIWDILGEADKQSIVVGVPQTFPIRPFNGYMVSCFLTPDITNQQTEWTHPAELREEIKQLLGPELYDVDVPQFRTDDKAWLLKQIYAMTEKRFKVLRHLLTNKQWDFFMFVEMGVDRLHHGFWSHHDPSHPKHDPESTFKTAVKDYYHFLDREIGSLLVLLPNDTHIIVVSDHGVTAMEGGFCINEWLRKNGYLTLYEDPPAGWISPFEKVEVDWSKTIAWADGGYYGRIYLNVQGREPEGCIPATEYETVRDTLAAAIQQISTPDGQLMDNRTFKPDHIYRQTNNIAPDLLVYFGNLRWRSIGTFGHASLYNFGDEAGPDDANHAQNGIWIRAQLGHESGGKQQPPAQLMDVAPTVLSLFGIDIPFDMQGKVIR